MALSCLTSRKVPTSHEIVAWVRKMFGQERAGHSGTLDPMVSGILPIGLGNATKALSALLLGPKEYVCVARIHDSIPKELALRFDQTIPRTDLSETPTALGGQTRDKNEDNI